MRKYYLVIIILLSLTSQILAQGPGEPFNLMTANGATGIARNNHILFWQNPDSTIYNKIYFSDDISLVTSLDTSAILVDGYPGTAYSSLSLDYFGYLDALTNYYWRIVEYNQIDSTVGPILNFKSQISFSYDSLFFDNFEDINFTSENWTIKNDGGNCIWEQYFQPYPNSYTLPNSSAGGVLAADSDECGSGTTLYSSAIIGPFPPVFHYGRLTFDQDFNAIDSADEAWVEISTDNGFTWSEVWSQIGVDLRSTHEEIFINSNDETLIRFRSVQTGWDWWWVIDNVFFEYYPFYIPTPPSILIAEADSSKLIVNLNWNIGSCADPISYEIQRKNGLPLDTSSYSVLAVVDGNTFSFADTTVIHNSNYTYKIRTLCGPPGWGSIWGNEATAYVPDIITTVKETENVLPTEFYLSQNFPNPFNPTTTIKYQIAELSFVTIKVYDVLGNEIATLVSEKKSMGSYEVEFDPSTLPSGVYFYRLQVGSFVKTKKMVLLR